MIAMTKENGFKGYELESGGYELKLMTGSHHLKRNVKKLLLL